MSSPDEVYGDTDAPSSGNTNSGAQGAAPEAVLGQEGRRQSGKPPMSYRAAQGASLVRASLDIGEGEGGLAGIESCQLEGEPKLEAAEGGEGVLRDPEGRTSSPVDQEEVGLDFLPQLSIEAMTIMRELTNLQTRRFFTYTSPQSCAAELAAIWGRVDEGSKRGPLPLSSVEGKQASSGSLYPRGLGRSRAWAAPRRGTTSRIVSSEGVQCPSTNSTSSDEFSETPVMRVTISLKEGGQAKSSGHTELEDTSKHTNVQGKGGFVHVPPSVLSSANRGLSSGMEKQAFGELEGSLSKKRPSMVWGKEGSRPSYPGATAAAASSGAAPASGASGALHKTSPKKKTAQEKKSLSDASRGPLGRTFPPWGQRLNSAPVGPSALPPISGVALLRKASKCSLPSGPKECKPFCTGKRSAKKIKESQLRVKEDSDLSRDPGLQAQLPTHRAEQAVSCAHRGEMTSRDANFRAAQVSGNSQLQRSARPRAPASADDQDQLVDVLLPVEDSEPVIQGTPGCPQCLMLQKEIEELKEQLAIMQALNEKFQDL